MEKLYTDYAKYDATLYAFLMCLPLIYRDTLQIPWRPALELNKRILLFHTLLLAHNRFALRRYRCSQPIDT